MRGGLVRFALWDRSRCPAAPTLSPSTRRSRLPALLAMLVVNANTVLSAGRPIHDLWAAR